MTSQSGSRGKNCYQEEKIATRFWFCYRICYQRNESSGLVEPNEPGESNEKLRKYNGL